MMDGRNGLGPGMPDTQRKRGVDWASLILGILFVIAAFIAFRDPVGDLKALVWVFGVFAIVKGVFEIFIRSRVRNITGSTMIFPLIMGIVDIMLGIFFLLNNFAGMVTLGYLFAFWFIFDSIMGLLTLNLSKRISQGYFWFSLVINVIGVILGVYLLFNPLAALLTLSFLVGFYFLMFGLMRIVYAFG